MIDFSVYRNNTKVNLVVEEKNDNIANRLEAYAKAITTKKNN